MAWTMWSVYDKDHMSELRIENRSERDLRSCEVTQAVTNKAQKNFWGSNEIRTQYDLRDTGANFFWAIFITAWVTSQLRRSLSLLWHEWVAIRTRQCFPERSTFQGNNSWLDPGTDLRPALLLLCCLSPFHGHCQWTNLIKINTN